VAEINELARIANAIQTVAAGGTPSPALTTADLIKAGLADVTDNNLAAVIAAIAAKDNAGGETDSLGELQALIDEIVAHPALTTTLSGVTNLDVTSDLVFSSNQSLKVGTGQIHITDLGGAGYRGESTTHTQDIDVSSAVANRLLTISGTGANTKIIINPLWDLDLSSNYQISIDAGAFTDLTGTHTSAAFAPVSFSTVTPGTHSTGGLAATEALESKLMLDTGALAVGKFWLDIEGINTGKDPMTQLGTLANKGYALVMKNYATSVPSFVPGSSSDGIAAHDTNVGVINFGIDDMVYFDSQVNNLSIQKFDPNFTLVGEVDRAGGLQGQTALQEMTAPGSLYPQAFIALGFEGNTSNTTYGAIHTIGDTPGFAEALKANFEPVIMG
jgi:hypothetical protein